jgi:hypothetical protein
VNGKFCKDSKLVSANDFFFSGLNIPRDTSNPLGSTVTLLNMDKIVGISLARINFAPYGLNPPHIHPRETEILVVLEGTLLLGFVTSNIDNCLFTKVLNAGDVFVFPIGLIHFQFNTGCCANFNTRKRTNRLQYSVCASARSYPQGIVLRKLISIQTNPILT